MTKTFIVLSQQWRVWFLYAVGFFSLVACAPLGVDLPTEAATTESEVATPTFESAPVTTELPSPTASPEVTGYPNAPTPYPPPISFYLPYPPPSTQVRSQNLSAYPGMPTVSAYPGMPTAETTFPKIDWSVSVTEIFSIDLAQLSLPSKSSQFGVICGNNDIGLYRRKNNQPIYHVAALENSACPLQMQFAPDDSALAMTAYPPAQNVYLWRTDGSAPFVIGQIEINHDYHLHWSTDSELLAFITQDNEEPAHTASVRVVDHVGQLVSEFNIAGGTDFEDIYWLNVTVICRTDRNSIPCHNARTGEHLFDLQGWHADAAGALLHQPPSLAPNQRWLLLDESYFGDDLAGDQPQRHMAYRLFDIQTAQAYPLPDSGSNPLVFSGWKADSSAAYVISRPADADSLPTEATPFGLLELNVETHATKVLFAEAMQAIWSPDGQWALLVFPDRAPDNTLRLVNGLWNVETEQLLGRQLVSTVMAYADPGQANYAGIVQSFGTAAWSYNSHWVVFGNAQGELFLLGTDGTIRPLATDTSHASWLQGKYTWSLDDQIVLVEANGRLWTIPLP